MSPQTLIPSRCERSPRHRWGIALVAGCCALASSCQRTPRIDAEASRAVGAATGMAAPVEFVAVGPGGGPLDEPGAPGALTRADALRRAVTTSPEVQMVLARVRSAMADSDQARLLANPVLSVVLRWGAGPVQVETSLAQELIQALQAPRRASAADHRLRGEAANAVATAIDVAVEVQERYIAAQASEALIPILRERLTLLQRLESVAAARLEAGEGTRSDLRTLEAQRVELQVEIDQGVLDGAQERLRLARLIGEPSSAADWTLDPWEVPAGANSIPSEDRWIAEGLSCRPEVQAVIWKLRALGDEGALAGLRSWEGTSAGVDAQRDGGWSVGPSLSAPLPLFDDGSAQRARVSAEQMEARHELTLARRKVIEEVRLAYVAVTAGASNLARIRDSLIPLQEQRRTLAEAAYRAGQSDVTVLYLAEQDLRLTQAKAIEAERRAATSLVRLQRAVGGPGVASTLMTPAPPPEPPRPEPATEHGAAQRPRP